MILNYYLFYIFTSFSVKYVTGSDLSSLTFVIDDTGSMANDIAEVKAKINDIFETVLSNKDSQIDNFILITFNDHGPGNLNKCPNPGVKVRANTKSKNEFRAALNDITVGGGAPGCEECPMSGIKLGLEESLPKSSIYVFTDATAKDYYMEEEVNGIAEDKQSQVVFVLTGKCREPDDAPRLKVYQKVADATDGQVFDISKGEVNKVLEFVKKTITGRRTTIINTALPSGSHNITFVADALMGEVILSFTASVSNDPSVDLKAPDGSDVSKDIIFHTAKVKVYSVNVTKPGEHRVKVDSPAGTRAVVTAKSGLDFIHGFSAFKLSSIIDTSTRPAPGVKSHLSIKLTEGDITVKAVQIIGLDGNVILELPMEIENNETKLYTTKELFDPPNKKFKIAMIGYDAKSDSNVTRTSSTPVEPQKILPGEKIVNKAPSIVIEGGPTVNGDYDKPLQLYCKVEGYPKPAIIWKNVDTGAILSSKTSVGKDFLYNQISALSIEKVTENATYSCEATNPSGSDSKQITVEVIRKRYLKITTTSQNVTVEYEKVGEIFCAVDAYPPADINWYKNDEKLTTSSDIEIKATSNSSTVTIKQPMLADDGKYSCEAKNEDTKQLVDMYVTVIERPEIDKHMINVTSTKGSSATIECKILKGKPKPSITWTFGATSEMTSVIEKWKNQEQIVLNEVNNLYSGIYQCQAQNDVGSDQHNINLVVEYQPTIVKIDKKLITVKTGSKVSITCEVDGVPAPHVTWLKDDEEITSSTKIHISDKYTISFIADSSDSGDYVCRAMNKVGTDDKSVKLFVTEPPEIDKHVTNVIATKGLGTKIECKILKGKPKPSVSWSFGTTSKISLPIAKWKDQEQIAISSADKTDSGIYQCKVKNDVGSDQHEVNLTVQYVPTIVKKSDKELITIKTGSEISISCDVDSVPPAHVKWLKNNVEIANNTKTHIFNNHTISFIAEELDSGDYICNATNKLGIDIKTVEVYITVPATIELPKILNRTLTVGVRRSTFACKPTGIPEPEIKWTYQSFNPSEPSQEIKFTGNLKLFVLENIQLTNEGNYTCTASNSAGSDNITYTVHVFEMPRIEKPINTKVFVEKGSSIKLDCKILKGNPKPSITWFFKLLASDRDSPEKFKEVIEWRNKEHIVVEKADKNKAGKYRCQAENRKNSKDYLDIKVILEYPPVIDKKKKEPLIKAAVGLETIVPCHVDGSPLPQVTWTKDGVSLADDGKPYTFVGDSLKFVAELSNAGFYTCNATNKLDSDILTSKVVVTEPATIIEIPLTKTMSVLVGNTVSLPCKTRGNPKPDIRWTYQAFDAPEPSKTPLIHLKNNSLKLERIQACQEGNYTCTARNSGGFEKVTYGIQVFVPALVVNTYKEKRFVVVEGDLALNIDCNATGNPKPTITWTKDNSSLSLGSIYSVKNGTITIANIPKDAGGNYNCEVENPFGKHQAIYEVVVKPYPPPDRAFSTTSIEEGHDAEVKCSLPHKSIDLLRWYKNGILIQKGELSIKSASMRDSGDYVCRVSTTTASHSRTINVFVGFKPKFLIDEDEDVDMVEGLPVRLNCVTDPEGDVTWYHNDKKMDSTDAIYHSVTGLNSPGQYTCEVKNTFGSISRTFNAVQKYCEIDPTKVLMNQQVPLTLNTNLTLLVSENDSKNIVLPKGRNVTWFCPNGFNTFPTKHLTGACDGDANFIIDEETYKYTEFMCTDEVKHIVIRTGEQCMTGYTEMVKIAYKLSDDAELVIYEICLNLTNYLPLYAKHIFRKLFADADYEITWSDSDEFGINFDEAYTCFHQLTTIGDWLGKNFYSENECCFGKRQLVNIRDVYPGVPQKSTYSYFNAVPKWSSCDAQNWDEIEQRVRDFVKTSQKDLLVWTGTAQELTYEIEFKNINIYLTEVRRQPVPLYLWKVIQDPISKSSLAVIQVNLPDLNPAKVHKYVLCKDVCDGTGWMSNPEWVNVNSGYTYCCSLQDFENAFGFKGVFEPNMMSLLTSDAITVT